MRWTSCQRSVVRRELHDVFDDISALAVVLLLLALSCMAFFHEDD